MELFTKETSQEKGDENNDNNWAVRSGFHLWSFLSIPISFISFPVPVSFYCHRIVIMHPPPWTFKTRKRVAHFLPPPSSTPFNSHSPSVSSLPFWKEVFNFLVNLLSELVRSWLRRFTPIRWKSLFWVLSVLKSWERNEMGKGEAL